MPRALLKTREKRNKAILELLCNQLNFLDIFVGGLKTKIIDFYTWYLNILFDTRIYDHALVTNNLLLYMPPLISSGLILLLITNMSKKNKKFIWLVYILGATLQILTCMNYINSKTLYAYITVFGNILRMLMNLLLYGILLLKNEFYRSYQNL